MMATIAGVELDHMAAMYSAYHVMHLIQPTLLPSEIRTSQPLIRRVQHHVPDVIHYSTAPTPRGTHGPPEVRMEQKSWSKFLSWSGFEPRTSHLAVQHATTRPCTTLHLPIEPCCHCRKTQKHFINCLF